MNMQQWLMAFMQEMLLLPAMFFCALPIERRFRYPKRTVYALATVCVSLLSACMATLHTLGLWTDPNSTAILIAVVGCAVCRYITDVKLSKLLNIFINAVAAFSFTGFACIMMESRLYPDGDYRTATLYGLAMQWVLELLLLAVMYRPLQKQYAWLISDYHEEYVWRISWLVPALIAGCILVMVPREYSTMRVGRVFEAAMVIFGVLLFLLIFFNIVFYRMARRSVERAQLMQRAGLLEIQASQYAKLKVRMEQSAQQRHDFRHSIHVLDELARNGDLAQLRRYAAEYSAKLDERPAVIYCRNAAVNALLDYYATIAEQNGVRVRLQIDLPEALPVAEVDLCSVLGNLMENAIDACRALPAQKRYLAITAEQQSGQRIYIVSTNAFDGNVEMRGGNYLSTKHAGEGMGLKSIRAIAERYHGAMSARTEGNTFCVDVYLRGNDPAGKDGSKP